MSDKLTDKLVGGGVKPELSPNPNGSGYTKQVEVDALSSVVNPEVNVLYICQGRKYKYLEQAIIDPATNKVLVPAGFVRVENGPQVHNVDGGRGTPVHENVPPQVPPRVFNEPVALNGGVTVKGKKLEDYIDSEGGVTEEELHAFVKANPTLAGTEPNLTGVEIDGVKYGVGGSDDAPKIYGGITDLSELPSEIVAHLKVGDIVVTSLNGNIYSFIVSYKEENEDMDVKGIYFVSVGSDVQEYRFVYDEENHEWVYDSDYSEILENKGLYLHRLLFTDDIAEIITSDATPFTTDTIKTWLTTNGYTSTARALCFVNKQMTKISDTEVNVYVGVNMTGSNLRKCYYRLTLTAGTGINTITLTQAQFNTNLQNDIVIEL